MEDSFQHKGLRNKLVEEIRRKGIIDERVLAAIGKVPRHLFMDSGFIKFAYRDQAFPIRAGQTISQPYTVAFQTQLLEVEPMQRCWRSVPDRDTRQPFWLKWEPRFIPSNGRRNFILKSQIIAYFTELPAAIFSMATDTRDCPHTDPLTGFSLLLLHLKFLQNYWNS